MPANYVLLERVEIGETAVSSITFNSIPQTGYTDLKIVYSARDSNTADPGGTITNIRFNGSTTTYTNKLLYGDGTSAGSASVYLQMIGESTSSNAGSTANTFGNGEVYIPNYTSSNYKSWSSDGVAERNATTTYAALNAGLWSTTSAITSIAVVANTSFVQYSTFSLYGLAAVGTTPTKAPKASGGSIIQTDGTYWYHAFLASGTFTPAVGLSCDVLVVAGGGGSGTSYGGGGGGGGLLSFTSQSVSTATTVTVGAGGAGGAGTPPFGPGINGTDSQLGALTLVKGGGGGGYWYSASVNSNGFAGGSGGGSGRGSQGSVGGAATSGQGNAGGTGTNYGGGGGAGAAGSTVNGGAGLTSSISGGATTGVGSLSGGSYYFSVGGCAAGGTRAAGGSIAGEVGAPNTGNGAGTEGLKGGSGIVIIRYAV